MKSYHHW